MQPRVTQVDPPVSLKTNSMFGMRVPQIRARPSVTTATVQCRVPLLFMVKGVFLLKFLTTGVLKTQDLMGRSKMGTVASEVEP